MYTVKDVFYTLQGEGFHAGKPAVFVRFSGCNMWSGNAEHRERDATRNNAACPRWCDTDFVGGVKYDAESLVLKVLTCLRDRGPDGYQDHMRHPLPLIVLTGGEPMLQVDMQLVSRLSGQFPRTTIAVETNGTVCKDPSVLRWLWTCVSPKTANPEDLVIREGNEIKIVHGGGIDVERYREVARNFQRRWVSPCAWVSDGRHPGSIMTEVDPSVMNEAAQWVMRNPGWRLSVQQHKIVGIP